MRCQIKFADGAVLPASSSSATTPYALVPLMPNELVPAARDGEQSDMGPSTRGTVGTGALALAQSPIADAT